MRIFRLKDFMRGCQLPLAAIATLVMASCSQVNHAEELQTNWQKWETAAISSYQLEMQQGCFCPDYITRPIHLAVTDSEISLTYTDDGSSVTEDARESLLIGPIPKIFEGIKFVIDSNPDDLTVVYNEEYGFPESITADPISSAIDDEFGFRVSNFQIIEED